MQDQDGVWLNTSVAFSTISAFFSCRRSLCWESTETYIFLLGNEPADRCSVLVDVSHFVGCSCQFRYGF
jgi:hypothetical protein